MPTADIVSAQAGDIQDALERANVWKKEKEVATMLDAAKVPENVKIYASIEVDKKLAVKIGVKAKPSHPSGAALAKLMNQKYAAPMKAAIQKARLGVADTIELDWMQFE